MSDLVGKGIGRYRLVDKIGGGGMSTVHRGFDAALNRYAAIKVMSEQMGQHDELCQRFRQEVQVISRLKHPHILPIYDYGLDGSQLFLAMRYVESGTLGARLAHGPLEMADVIHVMRQIGAALAYAHRKGVVHRDIKPNNVLIDARGDCFLCDFGLAKTTEASIRLTATGVGLGTPAYMSPEQGKGERVDARSDIYSLGAMLYEIVTGHLPYSDRSPVLVMLKHIRDPVPHPIDLNPQLPQELDALIVKALAKRPEDRFQTVDEMLSAFGAAVAQTSPPLVFLPDPPWLRRRVRLPVWALVVVGSILLAALVAGGVLLPRLVTGGP
jgi:serine/threonine protein kinase